ncbi:MAG: cation:proton antiporter [Thermoproteota archaeon]|nr:cation:proton antiporter [Thermoproteota archaeon]
MADFLLQIGLLTGLTVILGYLFRYLKLPLVTAYILIGLILGPLTQLVNPASTLIGFMAEMGILLITFEIGITMRLSFLRSEGLRIGLIALTELLVIIFLAYLAGLIFNLGWLFTIFLILFAVNTSTSMAFKLFEESNLKQEYKEREYKTAIGIATFEDLIAILGIAVFLSFITSSNFSISLILTDLFKLIFLFIGLIGLGVVFLKRLLNAIYKYGEELVLLSGIALALLFSWFASYIGLSPVLGAFIGGIVFSESKSAEYFLEKAKWVREIFAFIFFASIGLRFPVNVDLNLVLIGIALSLLLVSMKFLAFSFAIWISGFELEKAFKLSLYMLALSEFAVIITALALNYGIAGPEMLVIAVSVMVISSILASILTSKRDKIARLLVNLFPTNIRVNIENYISRMISQSYEKSTKTFILIREQIRDLLIIVSFFFTISISYAYFLDYFIKTELIYNQFVLIVLISSLLALYAVMLFEIYQILKRLFLNIFRASTRKRHIAIRIPLFTLSVLIILFIFSLTVLQFYFVLREKFVNLINIFGLNIFHVSIIVLLITFFLIFIYVIYKIFNAFKIGVIGTS